jgi:leucyl aminopeptidase
MNVKIVKKLNDDGNILALTFFEDEKVLKSSSKDLDNKLKGLVKDKIFLAKFGKLYSTCVSDMKCSKILLVGLGKKKDLTLEKVRKVIGKVVSFTKGEKRNNFSTDLSEKISGLFDAEDLGRAFGETLELSNYSFDKYLNKERHKIKVESVDLLFSKSSSKFLEGVRVGKIIGESSNFTKDLVNDHPGIVTPTFLEKTAKAMEKKHAKIKVKVLNKSEMEKLGMNALLGVARGSVEAPKLIIIEYHGGAKSEKFKAFVGKGITFDSGGYNLKPTGYMEDMKCDMGGAGAVLGTMRSIAHLGLKQNILGIVPTCENMIGANAQRPGDVVKAYNGKTIEILNTDAEGRLILADALAYTEDKYNPEIMIDLATLTGACVVALGYFATAVMGKDDELCQELIEAGSKSGDRVWQLPFYEDYHDHMNGSISDLQNISKEGRGAGSITAGVFLSKFVDKVRWAHLDIAGSAFFAKAHGYNQKGATGAGVRALSYWLLNR